jgi:hypothetical protein
MAELHGCGIKDTNITRKRLLIKHVMHVDVEARLLSNKESGK